MLTRILVVRLLAGSGPLVASLAYKYANRAVPRIDIDLSGDQKSWVRLANDGPTALLITKFTIGDKHPDIQS